MQEYDAIADWYATERSNEIGVPETMAFARALPRGAHILDVGCGNGLPITRALLDAGCDVVGLDSSSRMLARFRTNCPGTPAVQGLAEQCAFAHQPFEGAVCWGVLAHLDRGAQAAALASISRVLKLDALLLFTAGAVDDPEGTTGTMNGVTFRYYSFDVEGYRALLARNRLTVLDVRTGRGDHTYYLARKVA